MIFCWWWPVLCSQSFSGVSSLWQSAGKNSGTEHSHGFAMKHDRHNFFVQIPAGIATCIVFA
jgi:hypothetical protein